MTQGPRATIVGNFILATAGLLLSVFPAQAAPKFSYGGGDGSSVEQAVIIEAPDPFTGVDAEYQFLSERLGKRDVDWTVVKQANLRAKGREYDRITVELKPSGKKVDYYFDITNFYGKIPGLE